jgi:[ribosomal protein S18]-alanine N-acetyltransferase
VPRRVRPTWSARRPAAAAMIGLVRRLFGLADPSLSEARVPDAAAIAVLHGQSFRRGWSENEVEQLLLDRQVLAHRAVHNDAFVGFILSRMAAGEAEILSVAVDSSWQGRGLGKRLLDLHLRRLAGLGVGTVFLEVEEQNAAALRLYHRAGFREVGRRPGYYPQADGAAVAARVLRRDL